MCCTCRVVVLCTELIAFLDVLVDVAIVVAKAPYSPVIRLRCVFLFLAGLRFRCLVRAVEVLKRQTWAVRFLAPHGLTFRENQKFQIAL